MMTIVIATGASGGHIFPALCVGRELSAQGHRVYFAGVFGRWRGLIDDAGFSVMELPARSTDVKSLKEALVSAGSMLKSFAVAWQILNRVKPDRVIGFGGYAGFSIVGAAILKRIFTAVHEQNVIPGRANRVLGWGVRKICISFSRSRRWFPAGKVVETGYPLRVFSAAGSPRDCRRHFNLDPDRITIAVCGGSQGSRALNFAMIGAVKDICRSQDIQVLHLTGEADQELVAAAYRRQGIRAEVLAFLDSMELFYGAADLVVARAGAGAVHEIARCRVPAVLIPYPFAGAHQKQNARAFFQEGGQGVLLEERFLKGNRLSQEIQAVLAQEVAVVTEEQNSLVRPDAARKIAEVVIEG